jgi:hypothetical protein
MTNEEKNLTLALQKIEELNALIVGNEFEFYISKHTIPIKFELLRQLENLKHTLELCF